MQVYMQEQWKDINEKMLFGVRILVCIEVGVRTKRYYPVVAVAEKKSSGIDFTYDCLPYPIEKNGATPRYWIQIPELPFQDEPDEHSF